MGIFKVSILGNGAAVPTSRQHPSSQLLQHNSRKFMIDCGEGTQMQMLRYKLSYRNLAHIFISHLHGDHFLGLMGMLSTFNLFNRTDTLHVYGPADLQSVIDLHLKVSDIRLHYELIFHSLPEQGLLFEDEQLTVRCFPLKHRVPTWGFLFREKEKTERNLIKEFVDHYKPGLEKMKEIKHGADYITPEGKLMENEKITYFPEPRSYAYCCDTAYDEAILPYIQNANLLYHEATFDNAAEKIAAEKFHSTAKQAATIAKNAGVKELLLGHFSARYKDREHLLAEASSVFEQTVLSREGETYLIH